VGRRQPSVGASVERGGGKKPLGSRFNGGNVRGKRRQNNEKEQSGGSSRSRGIGDNLPAEKITERSKGK